MKEHKIVNMDEKVKKKKRKISETESISQKEGYEPSIKKKKKKKHDKCYREIAPQTNKTEDLYIIDCSKESDGHEKILEKHCEHLPEIIRKEKNQKVKIKDKSAGNHVFVVDSEQIERKDSESVRNDKTPNKTSIKCKIKVAEENSVIDLCIENNTFNEPEIRKKKKKKKKKKRKYLESEIHSKELVGGSVTVSEQSNVLERTEMIDNRKVFVVDGNQIEISSDSKKTKHYKNKRHKLDKNNTDKEFSGEKSTLSDNCISKSCKEKSFANHKTELYVVEDHDIQEHHKKKRKEVEVTDVELSPTKGERKKKKRKKKHTIEEKNGNYIILDSDSQENSDEIQVQIGKTSNMNVDCERHRSEHKKMTKDSVRLGSNGRRRDSEEMEGEHKVKNKEYDRTGSVQENVITNLDQGYKPIHEYWAVTKEQKEILRNKGITFKEGHWSTKEIACLNKNVSEFLQEHEEQELKSLIFAKDTESAEFVHTQNMYQRFASGINRCLISVYRKVKRLYNENHLKGRWSNFEEQELKRLYNLHGSKWVLIGQILERSPESVCSKFQNFLKTEEKSVGLWSDEEFERLKQGVQMFSKKDDKLEISWPAVSSHVKTRSALQCRGKWTDRFNWNEDQSSKFHWDVAEDIELIKRLYNSCAEDEADVDWGEIMKGYSAFSQCPLGSVVRRKYVKLRAHVPDYQKKEFHEILDYLFNRDIPRLRLKKHARHLETETQVGPSEEHITP